MTQMMGVVNLGNECKDLKDLTIFRCNASVPFGGRYRFVDFVLSSMVNSDIFNVAVLTDKKYTSLMDHLKNGKSWDLNRKRDGLFILPPADKDNFPGFVGDIKNFYWHLDYFYRSTQEYVVIAGSQILLNIDYKNVLDFHIEMDADLTIVTCDKEKLNSTLCHQYCNTVKMDNQHQIIDIHKGMDEQTTNVSLDVYLLKRNFLIELIESSMIKGHKDFTKDTIMKSVSKHKMYGYTHQGYVAPIFSIEDYYQHSMNMLNSATRDELFHHPGVIYTKVKDEPPSKYSSDANVINSLVANGCHIEGTVENCIVFRGVKVQKGAVIRNSIIMQRCEISENALIENVILDKEVYVTPGGSMQGEQHSPTVVARRMVI
ncbi:glucose-1-phosphate adenylyltransferase subunit GlgD [Desulfuribacillus stibiiarsenatis]|uniref:Glucose-1-phosphate adenylyltransferase subunit GlgD n=1 Tax=Desulfuribacillus stibiiarsenatis TaxID=1390249 RepID=A0A1E5L391_9FIRM|nr:glucose-1-phosphate adenylyltransferase subunit GlgD [Desulfuribacillus stibiiarsenatis]OEH84615.1 glucose-1-phosphate adenylyltransferase subunit GlgD [Desulfuribacillus stibiiarsenatis]